MAGPYLPLSDFEPKHPEIAVHWDIFVTTNGLEGKNYRFRTSYDNYKTVVAVCDVCHELNSRNEYRWHAAHDAYDVCACVFYQKFWSYS